MPLLPPIISSTFPPATPGPFQSLGYTFIRSSPISPFTFPSPIYKDTSKPALSVKEVAYAVYYPASPPKPSGWFSGPEKHERWLPEPVGEVVKGYEKFLGKRGLGWIFQTIRVIAGRLKFSAYPLAHLHTTDNRLPLLIFSHGLAGTRNAYSQYCSALASEGYVVLAIQHNDGSAPYSQLPPETEGGEPEKLPYIKYDEVTFTERESRDLTYFRTLQLDIRVREVYEAYYSFKNLLEEDGGKTIIDGMKETDRKDWLGSFRNRVDFSTLSLSGHSFGGGSMLHLIQTPSPDKSLPALPIKNLIALDPWLDPVASPASSSKASPTMPPILVVNSEGFTVWSVHFQRLFGMIKKANGNLMTIVGASHQSFSDFPILIPPSPAPALALLSTVHELSTYFLNGKLRAAPSIIDKEADNGVLQKGEDGKGLKGKLGDVVVHLFTQ